MTNIEASQPEPETRTLPDTRSPGTRLLRLAGIGVTVVVTLAVWASGALAGADYVLRDSSGSVVIGPTTTATVTLVIALLGWGALGILERLTRHAATIWAWSAAAVVTASMIPILLVGATPATQVSLFFVHLAVAVLIPALLWARTTDPAAR